MSDLSLDITIVSIGQGFQARQWCKSAKHTHYNFALVFPLAIPNILFPIRINWRHSGRFGVYNGNNGCWLIGLCHLESNRSRSQSGAVGSLTIVVAATALQLFWASRLSSIWIEATCIWARLEKMKVRYKLKGKGKGGEPVEMLRVRSNHGTLWK